MTFGLKGILRRRDRSFVVMHTMVALPTGIGFGSPLS
jgi:hypothetical protein